MTEPKWTAGPWRHASSAGGWDAVYGPSNDMICRLALNCPANATLIAAAPELYAALAALLCHCEDQFIGWPASLGEVDVRNRTVAALAKARGETS